MFIKQATTPLLVTHTCQTKEFRPFHINTPPAGQLLMNMVEHGTLVFILKTFIIDNISFSRFILYHPHLTWNWSTGYEVQFRHYFVNLDNKMLDQIIVHKEVPGCFVKVPKTVRFILGIWNLNLAHDLFGREVRALIHNNTSFKIMDGQYFQIIARTISFIFARMVFCYHNCPNVLWEKIVLVWGKKLRKKFANSRP